MSRIFAASLFALVLTTAFAQLHVSNAVFTGSVQMPAGFAESNGLAKASQLATLTNAALKDVSISNATFSGHVVMPSDFWTGPGVLQPADTNFVYLPFMSVAFRSATGLSGIPRFTRQPDGSYIFDDSTNFVYAAFGGLWRLKRLAPVKYWDGSYDYVQFRVWDGGKEIALIQHTPYVQLDYVMETVANQVGFNPLPVYDVGAGGVRYMVVSNGVWISRTAGNL